jgi:hypothetical protein
MASGTIVKNTRTFWSTEINASRYGSPLAGKNAKSTGSSFRSGELHCSGFLPSQITNPSLAMVSPSMTGEGSGVLIGQLSSV